MKKMKSMGGGMNDMMHMHDMGMKLLFVIITIYGIIRLLLSLGFENSILSTLESYWPVILIVLGLSKLSAMGMFSSMMK